MKVPAVILDEEIIFLVASSFFAYLVTEIVSLSGFLIIIGIVPLLKSTLFDRGIFGVYMRIKNTETYF